MPPGPGPPPSNASCRPDELNAWHAGQSSFLGPRADKWFLPSKVQTSWRNDRRHLRKSEVQ
eukprot:13499094-Alexandrium_andersonii.AAC.1